MTIAEPMNNYVRCKFCDHRWLGVQTPFIPGAPTPGKDLACPQCRLDGATIVMDFHPQEQLL